MTRSNSSRYKVRTLADLMQDKGKLLNTFDQIDSLVAAFPLVDHPGNDLGDDEKWQRVMLHSPSNVFCLFTNDDKLAGYWSCFPVSDELYQQGISGNNINKTIDVDDINNFAVPGDYDFYFVDFFIYRYHTNPSSSRVLFRSFSDFLVSSAKNGYFVRKIFAHTSSPESINLCRNAGFRLITDHKCHVRRERDGEIRPTKIYEVDFSTGESNKIISNNRELSEIYGKRYHKGIENRLPGDVANIISGGESEKLEFKSTLRLNLQTRQFDQKMELSVLKSIVSFLNHSGGIVAVGINDSGNALGLGNDGFSNNDKLALHLINLVDARIGREFRPYISPHFTDYQGKQILLVICNAAPDPAFVKDSQFSRFFVRGGNATVELSGTELTSYLKRRF